MKTYKLISYDILEQAISGDSSAINKILEHYDAYINALSIQSCRDQDGFYSYLIDSEMKSQLQAKLTSKIFEFRLDCENK